MAAKWFVLQSKPNKEELLWGQLLFRQIETFYPRVRYKAVNPRTRKTRPFFPGYLFVRVDPGLVNILSLNWIPGAQRLVSFGGEPAFIPDGLLQAIRRHVEEINGSSGGLYAGLKQGETPQIETGENVIRAAVVITYEIR